MHEYKGKRPDWGWSIHMSGGWQSQFERVRRWHARALSANDPVDRRDFLYALFENALHLRDWLCDTSAATADEMEILFQKPEMQHCRDLANSHKHYSLNRPSSLSPPSEAREYSPGSGNLACDESLVVLSGGIKRDAFQLAGEVLRIWEFYIEQHIKPRARK